MSIVSLTLYDGYNPDFPVRRFKPLEYLKKTSIRISTANMFTSFRIAHLCTLAKFFYDITTKRGESWCYDSMCVLIRLSVLMLCPRNHK